MSTSAAVAGETIFISEASRGIGSAVIKRATAADTNTALSAKTADSHLKLPFNDCTAAGRSRRQVDRNCRSWGTHFRNGGSVAKVIEKFGRKGICVNNTSTGILASVTEVPVKRFDVNAQHPGARYLRPVRVRHFAHGGPPEPAHPDAVACRLTATRVAQADGIYKTKCGMWLYAPDLAEQLRDEAIASNTLFACTLVATTGVQNVLVTRRRDRPGPQRPDFYADAA